MYTTELIVMQMEFGAGLGLGQTPELVSVPLERTKI